MAGMHEQFCQREWLPERMEYYPHLAARFDQFRAGHTNQSRGPQCEHRPRHLDTYHPTTVFVNGRESLSTESAMHVFQINKNIFGAGATNSIRGQLQAIRMSCIQGQTVGLTPRSGQPPHCVTQRCILIQEFCFLLHVSGDMRICADCS